MTHELRVDDVIAPPPTTWQMIRRALRRRCPRCGSTGQFESWWRRSPHCPGCGYGIERSEDFFLGAYLLNLMLTLIAMFCVLIFAVIFEAMNRPVPLVPFIAIGLVGAIGLPLFCYPYTFTMWAVFDLRSDPLELSEIARAVENLERDAAEQEPIRSVH